MAFLGRQGVMAPLTSADIPNDSITSAKIVASTIATSDLADNAVTSAKIGVDVIVAEDIAANAITVSEIQDDAITGAKLANDIAISTSGAITTTGAFTSVGITDGAVGATAITIDSVENVAIGSADSGRFDISGGSTVEAGTTLTINSGPTANKMPKLELASYNIATNNDIGQIIFGNFGGDGTADGYGVITAEREATGGDGGIGLTFGTGSSGTERMRIDQDGKVGIGTNLPATYIDTSYANGNVLNIKSASNRAEFTAQGDSGAVLNLIHLDGGSDDKWFRCEVTGGLARFESLNDTGSAYNHGDLMHMDLGSGDIFFGGKVGIADSSPSYLLEVNNTDDTGTYAAHFISAANSFGVKITAGTDSGDRCLQVREIGTGGAGNEVLKITADGNVNNVNGTYGSSMSDERMKENIVDGTEKLDQLNELRVVNFNFKDDPLKQLGFIAQEVAEIFPALVTPTDSRSIATQEEYDKLTEAEQDLYVEDEDGEWCRKMSNGEIYGFKDSMGLKTSILIPMLVKAVQELSAKVDALESA